MLEMLSGFRKRPSKIPDENLVNLKVYHGLSSSNVTLKAQDRCLFYGCFRNEKRSVLRQATRRLLASTCVLFCSLIEACLTDYCLVSVSGPILLKPDPFGDPVGKGTIRFVRTHAGSPWPN